jgi:hypothetical protein
VTTRPHIVDFFRLLELLRLAGVESLADWAILESLAQFDGRANAGALMHRSKLCPARFGQTIFKLAIDHTRCETLPRQTLLTLTGISNAHQSLPFTPPETMEVKLTAQGWRCVHFMGYRLPAIITDDLNFWPAVVADVPDPEALLEEISKNKPGRWTLHPPVQHADTTEMPMPELAKD